jgi:hypothetical protein
MLIAGFQFRSGWRRGTAPVTQTPGISRSRVACSMNVAPPASSSRFMAMVGLASRSPPTSAPKKPHEPIMALAAAAGHRRLKNIPGAT